MCPGSHKLLLKFSANILITDELHVVVFMMIFIWVHHCFEQAATLFALEIWSWVILTITMVYFDLFNSNRPA
ncbi:transmembrane protein, putative [Medicago truncatula]|uniref:Transmembrane protein, putative n=1 Tax=Medicago truncatula TaxID=3880 RepID=G7KBG4_MEDTR|nr:transmembrane protein, putative [Medicago truncatula]